MPLRRAWDGGRVIARYPGGEPHATELPASAGPGADVDQAAAHALAATHRHLDRRKLTANTVKACKRQTTAYTAWLTEHADAHPDAFIDPVGAEAAVTAWRKHLIEDRSSPSKANQALTAVALMYAQMGAASPGETRAHSQARRTRRAHSPTSLLGHATLDTSARYFRAGTAETTAVIERVFDQ